MVGQESYIRQYVPSHKVLFQVLDGGNVIIATTKKSCDFSRSFCYSA